MAMLTSALVPDEVTQHLADCPGCREDLAELLPLPGLLGVVDASELADDEAGELLLHRMLAEAARRRRRSRARTTALVAAAVAALLVVVPLARAVLDRPPAPPPAVALSPVVHRATNPATGVSAAVRLTAAGGGSTVQVEVQGVEEGTRCQLRVVKADGSWSEAATWSARYRGSATLRVDVALPPERIIRVVLFDVDDGQRLVAVPVT